MIVSCRFNGKTCEVNRNIHAKRLKLLSYQTSMSFNNIDEGLENNTIDVNGSTVVLNNSIVSNTTDLTTVLRDGIQTVAPSATVIYKSTTGRIEITGVTSIEFINNTGVMFGFESNTTLTGATIVGTNPVNLTPFRELLVSFNGINPENAFQTSDGLIYDLIIPLKDSDFSEDSVFYGRSAFADCIDIYNTNQGALRDLTISVFVILGSNAYEVNLPDNSITILYFRVLK